jgi:general secretion pathway protein G
MVNKQHAGIDVRPERLFVEFYTGRATENEDVCSRHDRFVPDRLQQSRTDLAESRFVTELEMNHCCRCLALPECGRLGRIRIPRGFTLIELMIVMIIIALIGGVALPYYAGHREKVKIVQAVTDIRSMEVLINQYRLDNRALPASLADIGRAGLLDPWNNPYRYLDVTDIKATKGTARKDKNLVPINSDYDLYSMGADGATVPPLTAKQSRDDIIRANDGRFIGPGADY